jgi:uncharacterized protein YkwD
MNCGAVRYCIMKLVLLAFLSFFSLSLLSQTEEELDLLRLINLCRTEPKRFLEEYARPYILENGLDKLTESRSLIRALDKQKELKPLSFAGDLHDIASMHAIDMGKKGLYGHKGFTSRYRPVGKIYSQVAENCSYGFDASLDILMQLLIDQGVLLILGHRKNLLSPTLFVHRNTHSST